MANNNIYTFPTSELRKRQLRISEALERTRKLIQSLKQTQLLDDLRRKDKTND